MLSIDDLNGDAQTFQQMITEQTKVVAEANATLFRLEGAFNYIIRCIKTEEDKEMEEGYKDGSEDNSPL